MDYCDYKYMDHLFLEEYKLSERKDVRSDRKLKIENVEHAIVLPCKEVDGKKCAGVLDSEKQYVTLSAFEALSPIDCWGGDYELQDTPNYIDEDVIYMGRFWKHWGHFIMDQVSRLWYAMESEPSLKIVYDGKEEISGVYLEFMRLAGIDANRFIRVDVPTCFRNVIIPECSYKPGIFVHEKYKMIFHTVSKQAMSEFEILDKYKDCKIYFTRTGLNLRVPIEVGEKDIEKLFLDNGYKIISPEKYSLTEQIVMYRQAGEIACVSGTIPHNMMFADDGAKIVIIRKTNKPNYRQNDINVIKKLKVTNVDAHISPFAVGAGGPFILDINENVRQYFSDRGMKYPNSAFVGFWKRKARFLWYIPFYFLRNRGKKREVPLFDGEKFTTRDSAKKELRRFYMKRLW